MENSKVIIVGAGASGLAAAHHLTAHGIGVTVLEARNRPGGRIHTIHDSDFSFPVEGGAEFVHGDLPETLRLLAEAGIPLIPAGGQMFRSIGGKWQTEFERIPHWNELMSAMASLTEDLSLATFLETRFPGEPYAGLRNSARGFAEGYDLADIRTASTMMLFREWTREEGAQHRVEGGYGRLIDYLAAGIPIHTGVEVRDITWSPGSVTIAGYAGNAALITVPLGVWPYLRFSPELPDYAHAAAALGFGSVIRVLLEFNKPFWDKQMGFLLSDQAIPTWWTQAPTSLPLLTGWLPGSKAKPLEGRPSGDILATALSSLEGIFGFKPVPKARRVEDWSQDPYARGAYSFPTVGEDAPRRLLNTPVDNTLYFAGEALYEGDHTPGTVEAALVSGLAAAERIVDTRG
jgi:monoamine oxidase